MLWPETTTRTAAGELSVGGISIPDLVTRFGSPLYVFDEATLRSRARRIRRAFTTVYPRSRVVYAGKAYLSPALVAILWEEGLGLDVVSGGELYAGLLAGVPASAMTFHGNNKLEEELRQAVEAGVGHIAVDNLWEVDLLGRIAAELNSTVSVLLRLNPGIDVHTHDKIKTAVADSKFGLPIATGDAATAVAGICERSQLALVGYHAHIGSQIFEETAYEEAIRALVAFAAEMQDRHGVTPLAISPGGGFGIAYNEGEDEARIEEWAVVIATTLVEECKRHTIPLPELIVEPGRAIIGPAGVAVYRVGAIKDIAGVRRYASVDGGMADNIRPSLYGARYGVALANRIDDGPVEVVTVAGKFCESGDILIRDARLPRLEPGDLLAIPAAGAYCLPMASNYNLAPRPAVVLVKDGEARLIRRRETFADLLQCDVLPESPSNHGALSAMRTGVLAREAGT